MYYSLQSLGKSVWWLVLMYAESWVQQIVFEGGGVGLLPFLTPTPPPHPRSEENETAAVFKL